MELIQTRRALHKIPEIGFQEYKTQAYLLQVIATFPQQALEIVTWRTGIIVKITGTKGERKIGWRTDIDGLPIQEETGVDFASIHPGFMHACGHDCHMTIALSLVRGLAERPPQQHVIVYFQPAEEGPGGAEPMMEWLCAERPDLLADEVYALHIAPEYPVGTIATRPGLLFANTSELNIELIGVGGHAAFPHRTRDMLVAASNLIVQLQTIVSRSIDPMQSAVVTVGKMTAGDVRNVIAETARLEGTIRTTNAQQMANIKSRVEAICRGIEASFDCQVTVNYGSMYYEVNNHVSCAQAVLQFAERHPLATSLECPAAMTGEDFGFFLKNIPGAMFWTGANSQYGLHHAQLQIDESLLAFNADFVERFMRTH